MTPIDPMDDDPPAAADLSEAESEPAVETPALWNPGAAGAWSLLFSPAFGAWLHAANWRALGQPGRAAANKVWVWLTFTLLVANLGTLFLPDSKLIDVAIQMGSISLLIGWYVVEGRRQVQHVQENFGDDYPRRGWGLPLMLGLLSVGAYCGLALILVVAVHQPSAKEVADEVKPLILAEWRKKPKLSDASIQDVTLVHQSGDRYTGTVTAVLGGHQERLLLEVTYDGWNIAWEVKPPESGKAP